MAIEVNRRYLCLIRRGSPDRHHFSGTEHRAVSAAIKGGGMTATSAVIGVSGQCQQREILPIEIVLQVEHAGKSSAGDFRLSPRSVAPLRTQQESQTAMNARAIKMTAGADPHQRPGC